MICSTIYGISGVYYVIQFCLKIYQNHHMYPLKKDLYDLFHNGLTQYLSDKSGSRLTLAHEIGDRALEMGYKESEFIHTCSMAMKYVRRADWARASLFLSACLMPIEKKNQQMVYLANTTLTLVLELKNVGSITYASHSWNLFLEKQPTDLIGTDVLSYVHPDDQNRFSAHLAALDQMPTTTSLAEYRFRHKTGQWRHFECFSRVVSHEVEGHYILLSARDVTDQMAKTEKLVRNQTQLVNAQRIAKLGSWEWNPKTDSIHWSREVSRMFNMEHEQAPKTLTDFIGFLEPDDAKHYSTILHDAVISEAPIDVEIRAKGVGEDRLIMHCVGQTLNGYTIGTMQDITERKKTEEKLAQYNEQLWDLSLHHNQLLDRERDRIAREIHDDLGQMLAVLKMDIYLLNEPSLPTKSKEAIKGIIRRVDTIIHSVNRITSDLRPAELDNLGLIETIEWLSMSFQQRSGIQITLVKQLNDDPRNQIPESGTIYRIIQDTLINIQQTSNVKRMDIQVELDPKWFRFTIHHDAPNRPGETRPFPDPLTRLSLVQRSEQLGGRMAFDDMIELSIPRTEDSRKMYIPKRSAI